MSDGLDATSKAPGNDPISYRHETRTTGRSGSSREARAVADRRPDRRSNGPGRRRGLQFAGTRPLGAGPPRLLIGCGELALEAFDALPCRLLGAGGEVEDLDGDPAVVTRGDEGLHDRPEVDVAHPGS